MTAEFKPEKISDIEAGDIVLLQWDGYEGVPKYLSTLLVTTVLLIVVLLVVEVVVNVL